MNDASKEYFDPPPPEEENHTNGHLTFYRLKELLALKMDDSDIILGERVLAKGQPLVLAGMGGIGKSRLILQLIAACISGRKFLIWDTHLPDLKWMVLQTENSIRRLITEAKHIVQWIPDYSEKFDQQVVIQAVRKDTDAFVSMDSLDNRNRVQQAIDDYQPDVVVFDPLIDFAAGDLNSDADMKNTLQHLSRIYRKGNPDRAAIISHHALTGKAGALKAVGYDRTAFARNSKALFAWTRAQINIAPVDPEDNSRLIVACGKCSNGPEFPTFAISKNQDSFIYEPDPSVNIEEWTNSINDKRTSEPIISNEEVAQLCKPFIKKPELARAIMEEAGCCRQAAYRYIKKATNHTISYNEKSQSYLRK